MSTGWIKIDRGIINHWVWNDPLYLKAWVSLLLSANHEEKKVLIQGELLICKRGQTIISLSNLVKLFGKEWSIQRVRTFLKLLSDDAMIEVEGLRKTTRVTICKYDTYQDSQQANNKQTTNRKHSNNKQTTTTKECKELEEEKEDNNYIQDSPYGDGRLHFLCREHAKENPDRYSKEMYIGFLEYWTAPVQTGPKKDKELWTTEKTFQLSSRLATNYKLFWEGKGNRNRDTSKSIFG